MMDTYGGQSGKVLVMVIAVPIAIFLGTLIVMPQIYSDIPFIANMIGDYQGIDSGSGGLLAILLMVFLFL